MDTIKPASQSLTIWSAATAGIMAIANYFEVQITEQELNDVIMLVVQLGSIAGVIYGRLRADKKIA